MDAITLALSQPPPWIHSLHIAEETNPRVMIAARVVMGMVHTISGRFDLIMIATS